MKGVKVKDIAPRIGMSATSFSRRLNGFTPFTAGEIVMIGEELELSAAAFTLLLTGRFQAVMPAA